MYDFYSFYVFLELFHARSSATHQGRHRRLDERSSCWWLAGRLPGSGIPSFFLVFMGSLGWIGLVYKSRLPSGKVTVRPWQSSGLED
jgi:hypothetical protein